MQPNKVFIVMGGYDYEGADPIYVALTQEKADAWVQDNWEEFKPYPNNKQLSHLIKMRRKGSQFYSFDYISVVECPVEAEIIQY